MIVFFLFWSYVVSTYQKDMLCKQMDMQAKKVTAGTKKPVKKGNGA